MLEPELPTCESYTRIWSSEQLLRVVSASEYSPTMVLNCYVFRSCYPRVHRTMGIYGRHPQIRKPKVLVAFGEPCCNDRHYALAARYKGGR